MKIKYQDLKHEDPNQDIYIEVNNVIFELKDKTITLRDVVVKDIFYGLRQPDWDVFIQAQNFEHEYVEPLYQDEQ